MKRTITIVLLALASALAVAAPASAHITAAPDTTAAGAFAYVKFGVGHGCDEAGTTSVSIKIPQDEFVFTNVTPYLNPNWDVETEMTKLKEPADNHGEKMTEGVGTVTYTYKDGALPHDRGDALYLSIRLPEDAAGKTIYFPVVQKCEGGKQTDWISIPAEGEDEPEHPAASIAVTEAMGDEHHGGAMEADDEKMAPAVDLSKYATDKHVHDHEKKLYVLAGAALALSVIALGLAVRGRKRG